MTSTNNLQEIPLLKDIEDYTENTISMGIGIGYTPREAKNNAYLALQKSVLKGGNTGFVLTGNAYVGPFHSSPRNKNTRKTLSKENYDHIAENTNVSVDLIYSLACLIEKNKKDTFTSKELSLELGNSLRSTNRLIEKFLDSEFATIVGYKKVIGSGRPIRLIRFNI